MSFSITRQPVTPIEADNAVLAQLAGNPEWAWSIDIKHALSGTLDGHLFNEAVNRLVADARLERRLVPGRGFQIRIAHAKGGAA